MRDILSRIQGISYMVALEHLAIGAVLSLVLGVLYVRFGRSLSNRREFSRVFPIITLAVIIVITVVKTSLALSLGLIGALSIVRFRTPVKEPEELAFLFLAIAAGIGLGADQVGFTVSALGFTFVVIVLLGSWPGAKARSQNLYLSVSSTAESGEIDVPALAKSIANKLLVCDIRRVDASAPETRVSFHVEAADSAQLFTFLEEFRLEYPNVELTVVEQQRVPGV